MFKLINHFDIHDFFRRINLLVISWIFNVDVDFYKDFDSFIYSHLMFNYCRIVKDYNFRDH